MIKILRRFFSRPEVDRASIFGALIASKGLLFGPITAFLISAYFSPEVQGYYYTFGSLLALQVFLEMGLGQVITQFASHEWAQLALDENRSISGNSVSLSRLSSLARVAFRWYWAAGIAAAIGLGFAGYWFFSHSPQTSVNWLPPWIMLSVLTGIKLSMVPYWSILEGCNQVSETYRSKFIEGILVSIATCIAIVFAARLWTPIFASAVSLLWWITFLSVRYKAFFRSLFSPTPTPSKINWRREVWPMQWRIALSWLSGYLSFSLFTPVLFHYYGSVTAGRMGMTWSLVSALSAVSFVWVITKSPQFGMLIARKDYHNADRLLLRSATISLLVAVFGGLVLWLGTYALYLFDTRFAHRILSPLPTALFIIATIFIQISMSQSVYLRAHKREPLVAISAMSGILISLSTWLLGWRFGPTGVAAGYLAIVALFIVPYETRIWKRCRSEWHQPEDPSEVRSHGSS